MSGERLKLISVKIPAAHYEAVKLLVERGLYANFSEAMRAAISLLLKREAELAALLAIIREQERALQDKEAVLAALKLGASRHGGTD